MALNSLFCADVPLSNYSLTHFVAMYAVTIPSADALLLLLLLLLRLFIAQDRKILQMRYIRICIGIYVGATHCLCTEG